MVLERALTVKQFSQKHRAWSEGSLRWLIFNAEPRMTTAGLTGGNGLQQAIIRIGRRVYLHEERFFVWFESQCAGNRSR
ncbi:MAG: hypothetical protein U1F45_08810 [Burkholderiales bacterium]